MRLKNRSSLVPAVFDTPHPFCSFGSAEGIPTMDRPVVGLAIHALLSPPAFPRCAVEEHLLAITSILSEAVSTSILGFGRLTTLDSSIIRVS